MQAGKLRFRITIQRPDPASPKDAAGQPITQWLDVVTNWPADINPLSGRDQFIAAQMQASTTHIVKYRYGPPVATVDASHRILFGTRAFYLDRDPINVGERNVEYTLQCTEGLRVDPVGPSAPALLIESGGYLLLESGGYLLLG